MKGQIKSFVTVFAVLALAVTGCSKKEKKGGEKTDPPADKSMDSPTDMKLSMDGMKPQRKRKRGRRGRSVARVLAGLAALSAGKLDEAVKGFADNVVWSMPGGGPQALVSGRDALKAQFAKNREATPDLRIVPKRVFRLGRHDIVAEVVMGGTAKATGKRYAVAAALWFKRAKRQITHVYTYTNMVAVLRQTGAWQQQMPGKGKRGKVKGKAKRRKKLRALAKKLGLGKGPWIGNVPVPFPEGKPEIIEGKPNPANETLMRDIVAKGDLAKYVDDQSVLYSAPIHREFKGAAAIRFMLTRDKTAFPDGKREVEEIKSAGDWIVQRVKMTGTHTGPLGNLPPTGRKVVAHALQIGHWVGGKLRWGGAYLDRLSIQTQLGLVGPKAGKAPKKMMRKKKKSRKAAK